MNEIDKKKYNALVALLKPSGEHSMVPDATPWSLEKNRTFTCKCGKAVKIKEEALRLSTYTDAKTGEIKDIVTVKLPDEMKCNKCGRLNYELMTFAMRYGLLTPVRVAKKKPIPQPMLPLEY